MHQLRVLRCDICQAPFLFESSLEDHKNRDHAPIKENDYASVESKSGTKLKSQKKSRAKRKQKST